MRTLFAIAASALLAGCTIMPRADDLLSTLPPDEAFQHGIVIEDFAE